MADERKPQRDPKDKGERTEKYEFKFSSDFPPALLDKEAIGEITDIIAQSLAEEARAAVDVGGQVQGLHIRFGGGHSRQFSRSGSHKNVIHGRWGGGGSGDIGLG